MTNKPSNKKREKLRKEYQKLARHSDKLGWCNQKANELKMSYGEFVTWLGI